MPSARANFRAMEAQFPGTTAKAGTPRALPKGEPLPVSDAEIDAFMTAQNVAGLMVIQDGKVRLERYGLGLKPRRIAGPASRSPSRSPRRWSARR